MNFKSTQNEFIDLVHWYCNGKMCLSELRNILSGIIKSDNVNAEWDMLVQWLAKMHYYYDYSS